MSKRIIHFLILLCFYGLRGQVNEGLVAKYSFNFGDARDEAGKNNAKVVGVFPTKDRFGNKNSAYYLQGSYGSYLNLGTSGTLKPDKGSISIWVKMENEVHNGSGAKCNPFILTKSQSGDDFYEGYWMSYDLNSKRICVATTFSELYQVSLRSSEEMELGKWYHVVLTYDDNFLSLYVNGTLEDKMAKNFKSHFLEGDSVMVGNTANAKNQRYFNGCADDILIYNRVLSPSEVLSLYNAPNPNNLANLAKGIVIGVMILVIILAGWWFIKWRINVVLIKEKERNEVLNWSFEQNIKVLKAQMDPHFIFNSLNTIQQFIIVNDNEKAQLYLSKFSRLIRKLLDTNTREHLSLNEEMDILNRYLEIESLRFDGVFKPEIVYNGIVPDYEIHIPHLMVQPIVENAIWHGLRPKKGERNLTVRFELISKNVLSCIVDDNGVGRKKEASPLNPRDKSLAINFIKQRLDLMGRIYNEKFTIHISDKLNALGESEGTTVQMTMPVVYNNNVQSNYHR